MTEEQMKNDEVPLVYKKEKSTVILLFDGIFDLSVGFLYLFFMREPLNILTEPIEAVGLVDFNIMLFLDILIILEFGMAILELIAVYYVKFTENQATPKFIKRAFIATHVILIPLGGLLNIVIDWIMM